MSTKVHTPYRLEVRAAYFAALLTLEWVAAAVLLLFWLATPQTRGRFDGKAGESDLSGLGEED